MASVVSSAPWRRTSVRLVKWTRSPTISGAKKRRPWLWASSLSWVSEKPEMVGDLVDRKSTRLNSSHPSISYAVFCLKKKKPRYILRDKDEFLASTLQRHS